MAVTSKTLPLTELEDLGETRLAQKISQQPGVGLVSVSRRPAARRAHAAQSAALAAYGLNIDDVRTTLGNANVNTPKGSFDGPTQASTINANDQITNADGYAQTHHRLSQRRAGAARATSPRSSAAPENSKLAAWANRTPGDHPQRPAPARRQRHRHGGFGRASLLPQLLADLPAAVDVEVLTDRTVTIRASVADVRIRTGARRRAGRAGDLRVPAHAAGDAHSQPVGAAVAGRHLRRRCICWASASTICR